jgi:hypothetical protein
LEYFDRLLGQATLRQDVLLAARSKVLQARAYYSLPAPNLPQANTLLRQVAGAFPAGMRILERAIVHELHGDIRRDAGFVNAHASYMNALVLYSQVKEIAQADAAEAEQGVRRVTLKIADLSEGEATEEPEGSDSSAPAPMPPSITPTPGPTS